LADALQNQGGVLGVLGQLPAALTCYDDAIAIYRQLVETDGRAEFADYLATALLLDLHRQLAMWESAAADMVKALTYAVPFLQSDSPFIPLKEEFASFPTRLHDLADNERT
jgi:hypothetical protein